MSDGEQDIYITPKYNTPTPRLCIITEGKLANLQGKKLAGPQVIKVIKVSGQIDVVHLLMQCDKKGTSFLQPKFIT